MGSRCTVYEIRQFRLAFLHGRRDTPTKIRFAKYIAAQSLLHVPLHLCYRQQLWNPMGPLSDVESVKTMLSRVVRAVAPPCRCLNIYRMLPDRQRLRLAGSKPKTLTEPSVVGICKVHVPNFTLTFQRWTSTSFH